MMSWHHSSVSLSTAHCDRGTNQDIQLATHHTLGKRSILKLIIPCPDCPRPSFLHYHLTIHTYAHPSSQPVTAKEATMSAINYRTIDVDILDPESSVNFPISTLLPSNLPPPSSSSAAASIASQVRQLLRSGDSEGALRHALDTAPLAGDDRAKEVHLATVIEVLQGIRQGEMTQILEGVCSGEGGVERGDCLMKYL